MQLTEDTKMYRTICNLSPEMNTFQNRDEYCLQCKQLKLSKKKHCCTQTDINMYINIRTRHIIKFLLNGRHLCKRSFFIVNFLGYFGDEDLLCRYHVMVHSQETGDRNWDRERTMKDNRFPVQVRKFQHTSI